MITGTKISSLKFERKVTNNLSAPKCYCMSQYFRDK